MSLRGPGPRLASLAAGLLVAAFVALLGSAPPLHASGDTLPGPTIVCATESGGVVTVRWAPVTGADAYETRWAMVGGPGEVVDWSQQTARTASGTEDSMSGLSTGTHWKVRVRGGADTTFSNFWSEIYFVVGQAPGCGSAGGGAGTVGGDGGTVGGARTVGRGAATVGGEGTVIGNTRSLGVSHRYDCRDDARHSLVGGWVDGTEVEMLGEGVGRCSGWFWVRAGDVGSWVRARFLVPAPAEALAMDAPPTRWIVGNTGGLGVSLRDVCRDAARLSVVGGLLDGTEVEVMETGAGSCAGWFRVRADEVTTWVRAQYVREFVPVPRWVVSNTGGVGVSHRDECEDGARLSAIGGWRDATMVHVQAQGMGRCAGWLFVEAHDATSWVRELYIERLSLPVVPATGGR